MRAEDLFDAIGELDCPEIPIRKKKKDRTPLFRVWGVAAACVAVIITGAVLFGMFRGSDDGRADPFLISAAEYPPMPQFPSGIDPKSDEYSRMYKEWYSISTSKYILYSGYTDALGPFTESIMSEFLADTEENAVISPLSLYLSLSMMADIMQGESRAQILSLLGSDSMENARETAAAVWNATYRDDGLSRVILSGSVWLNNSCKYDPLTVSEISEYYYASVFCGDMSEGTYSERYRRWLSESTGGMLDGYIGDERFDTDSVLTLASTVLLDVKWTDAFDKSATAEGVFHSPSGDVRCDYMKQSRKTLCYITDMYTAASLDMQGAGEMWFVLPKHGYSVSDVIKGEGICTLLFDRSAHTGAEKHTVSYTVPKFDISTGAELTDGLKRLGVTDAFGDGMGEVPAQRLTAEPMYISSVEQHTRVRIDEERAQAASYTEIDGTLDSPTPQMLEFCLDRPFVFFITNDAGMPIFIGVVNTP